MIPRDWLDRILEIDDLDAVERAEVEQFLATNEDARRLVARLRTLESQKGPRGEIPELELHRLEWESPRAREEAEESLRLLLRRVQQRSGAEDRAPVRPAPRQSFFDRWRHFFPAPILVPAAVGALVLLFWKAGGPSRSPEEEAAPGVRPPPSSEVPSPQDPAPPAEIPGAPFGVRSFTIGSRSGIRGGESGSAWKTGDSFVLRAELEREGNLVLIHVDPRGAVEVLYPIDDGEARRVFSAGALVEFPPDEDQEWVFDGEPGAESFLLAVGAPGKSDGRAVAEQALLAGRSGSARAAVLSNVVRALETSMGPVRTLAVDHRSPETNGP